MLGRDDEWMSRLERAHHLHLDAGDTRGAVRCALWIGIHHAARGEIGRARRCFGICLSGRPISPAIDVKSLVRLGLKLYVPGLR